MTELEVIKRAIRERHIEQLRDLDIVEDSLEISPSSGGYNDQVRWSEERKEQLLAGRTQSKPLTLCPLL